MCKHILFNDFNKETDMETIKEFASLTYDKDGYGAMFRTKDNGIGWLKALDIAGFYLELGDTINRHPIKDLVIHHRTSTNKNGIEYAHPFEYQGNYLTHNGVVDVPGKHDTKTTNDSEQLLHHLIKTDYETKTISGYFSCFIINKDETIVLVDETAPIYSNGRVFSSHKIDETYMKIECKKLTIPVNGERKIENIEVTKTGYGQDKAHLSLGKYTKTDDGDYNYNATESINYDNIDTFLRYMTRNDEMRLLYCKNKAEVTQTLMEIAFALYIELDESELEELTEYYLDDELAS
jgi:hypothetical protein